MKSALSLWLEPELVGLLSKVAHDEDIVVLALLGISAEAQKNPTRQQNRHFSSFLKAANTGAAYYADNPGKSFLSLLRAI